MEQLINFIIRPPRAEYNPKHDLLDQEFMLKRNWFQRKDLELVNSRGDTLQCSHYMPIIWPEGKSLPCVIYCHGNSGCRTDASEAAVILLPLNITVFTLDFSGSGLSGGEHVTLGWNEKDDLKTVVDYLRLDGNVSSIGLWGRSMGAVTCLMYGAEDPSIAGIVLDSPFSDLVDLMMELVDTYKVRVPKFTVKFVIQYMRRAIQKKANFDIMNLNATKVASSCFVPLLLGHAMDDDFIQPHHSDRIFDAYAGDKNIIKFEGDHNSPRPQFYFDSISIFFKNVLQPPENEAGTDYLDLSNDYFDQSRWSILHDIEFSDDLLDSPVGITTGNTEDSIRQLRSKRPMSSVVVPADISSKDIQTNPQAESSGSDSHPSSSNMISFEFSKDSPHGSYVPQSMDEEEYVEYPLDVLADFPTNVEEEERMLMEAVLESLKSTPSGVVEPSSNGPKTEKESKDCQNSISTQDNYLKTKVALTSGSEDENSISLIPLLGLDASPSGSHTKCIPTSEETEEACSSSNPSMRSQNFPVTESLNHSTDSSKNPSPDLPNRQTTGEDTNQKLSSNQMKPEPDTTDGTTVTVEVEKKEVTKVMDGLLRRWDLNFFRNR